MASTVTKRSHFLMPQASSSSMAWDWPEDVDADISNQVASKPMEPRRPKHTSHSSMSSTLSRDESSMAGQKRRPTHDIFGASAALQEPAAKKVKTESAAVPNYVPAGSATFAELMQRRQSLQKSPERATRFSAGDMRAERTSATPAGLPRVLSRGLQQHQQHQRPPSHASIPALPSPQTEKREPISLVRVHSEDEMDVKPTHTLAHSVIKQKTAPAPATKTVPFTFMIEDSSDDEDDNADAKPELPFHRPATTFNVPTLSAFDIKLAREKEKEKEAQRLASENLRREREIVKRQSRENTAASLRKGSAIPTPPAWMTGKKGGEKVAPRIEGGKALMPDPEVIVLGSSSPEAEEVMMMEPPRALIVPKKPAINSPLPSLLRTKQDVASTNSEEAMVMAPPRSLGTSREAAVIAPPSFVRQTKKDAAATVNLANSRSVMGTLGKAAATSSPLLPLSRQPKQNLATSGSSSSSPSALATAQAAAQAERSRQLRADVEAERVRKVRAENSRRQWEKTQALVREAAEKAKNDDRLAKEAEQRKQDEEKLRIAEALREAEERRVSQAQAAEAERDAETKRQEDAKLRRDAELKRQQASRDQLREKRQADARAQDDLVRIAAEKKKAQLAARVKEEEARLLKDAERKKEKERQEEVFRQRNTSYNPFPTSLTKHFVRDDVAEEPSQWHPQETDTERARRERVEAMNERNKRNKLPVREETNALHAPREEVRATKAPVSLNSLAGMQRVEATSGVDSNDDRRPAAPSTSRLALPNMSKWSPPELPPSTKTKPTGPVSLNSAAGQGLLSHDGGYNSHTVYSNPTPAQLPTRTASSIFPAPKPAQSKHHDSTLGEILPEDIKLLFWRNSKNEWQDIIEDYEEAAGIRRSEDSLRQRYRKVKDAVDGVNLGQQVLQRASIGNAEACEQLNRAVHGVWPVPKATKAQPARPLPAKTNASGSGRPLGNLQSADIQLVRWKDSGMQWPLVVDAFEQATGLKRAEKTLRGRYGQVKRALESTDLEDLTLDLAADGDGRALTRLNDLVKESQLDDLTKESQIPINAPHYGPALGTITRNDAVLVFLRESGVKVDELPTKYEETTGIWRAKSVLSTRYRTVKAAFDNAGVDQELLELVADGDSNALQRLNSMVRRSGLPSAPPSRPELLRSQQRPILSGPRKTRVDENEGYQTPKLTNSSFNSSNLSSGGLSRRLSNETHITTPDDDGTFHEPGAHRRTTGGKTMDAATCQYYIDILAEEREAEANDEEEEEVAETFTPADYVHYAYHVERREITQEEMDDDMTIEDIRWIVCDGVFTDICKVNALVLSQGFSAHRSSTLNDSAYGDDVNIRRQLVDGMASMTLTTSEGIVQARVGRVQRTYQHHIRPSTTVGFLNRECYVLKQRTTKQLPAPPVDELFDEAPAEGSNKLVEQQDVDDAVYSALEEANTRAIAYFVDWTYKSPIANLTVRDLEKKELRLQLKSALADEQEGTLFHGIAEEDDVAKEVWVEAKKLTGPRNI